VSIDLTAYFEVSTTNNVSSLMVLTEV